MSVSVPPGSTDRASGRMLRTLVLWALIVVGAVSLIQYGSSPSEEAPDISLSEFQHELEQHNIATVIVSGTHVHGVFRSPVVVKRLTVTHFSLRLPVVPTDTFTAFVARYGAVVVHDNDPAQSWSVIFLAYLPYIFIFMLGVVILAVWHWCARRRQAAW